MTAVLDQPADLTGLTDDELAAMYPGADDATQAAILALCERRDRIADSRVKAQAKASAIREEWREFAWSDYSAAEAATRGYLLSEQGKRETDEPFTLWSGPESRAMRLASEELRNWWLDHPRLTLTAYVKQRRQAARIQRDEREREAMDTTEQAPPVPARDDHAARAAARQERIDQAKARAGIGTRPRPTAAVAVRSAFPALSGPPATVAQTGPAQAYRTDDMEITGADWLNYMRMFFARYVVWPSEAALDTAVLWAAHTYARESMDAGAGLIWKATPRLFVLSKERNSGKLTVLSLLLHVCPRTGGLDTEPTEYGLLDAIVQDKPTLLIDELGILIGSDKRKAGVQSILLNGYTPKGTKLRQVDKKRQRVNLFTPIALGGLDVVEESPSENIKAILSRGPILHMKPSADGHPPAGDLDEEEDYVEEIVHRIRLAGMGWTITNREWLRKARPEPAEGAVRRWRQIWRPMLAIADGAGEDWPERARDACVKLRHGYAAADDEEREALTEVKSAVDDMKREMAGMFGGLAPKPADDDDEEWDA